MLGYRMLTNQQVLRVLVSEALGVTKLDHCWSKDQNWVVRKLMFFNEACQGFKRMKSLEILEYSFVIMRANLQG